MTDSLPGRERAGMAGRGAALIETISGIAEDGANGAIIGRNTVQRPRAEAMALLAQIVDIHRKA